MTTSFTPDQLHPVAPAAPPIVIGSNVRHKKPPPDLADAPGIVNSIDQSMPALPGKRKISVAWKAKGAMGPERWHCEDELENTD